MKNIITTHCLILRTWKQSDTPTMAAINADPAVMKYFPSTQDLTATEALISHINKHHNEFGYSLYAVELKATKEFIGFVGLNQPSFVIPNFVPKTHPIVEIGWRLASNHWGQGYATEAAIAVLDYAFNILKIREIISFTSEINSTSRRVMEKIGLEHSSIDDFDHPKIEDNNPLKRHVLYKLSRR